VEVDAHFRHFLAGVNTFFEINFRVSIYRTERLKTQQQSDEQGINRMINMQLRNNFYLSLVTGGK